MNKGKGKKSGNVGSKEAPVDMGKASMSSVDSGKDTSSTMKLSKVSLKAIANKIALKLRVEHPLKASEASAASQLKQRYISEDQFIS